MGLVATRWQFGNTDFQRNDPLFIFGTVNFNEEWSWPYNAAI